MEPVPAALQGLRKHDFLPMAELRKSYESAALENLLHICAATLSPEYSRITAKTKGNRPSAHHQKKQ